MAPLTSPLTRPAPPLEKIRRQREAATERERNDDSEARKQEVTFAATDLTSPHSNQSKEDDLSSPLTTAALPLPLVPLTPLLSPPPHPSSLSHRCEDENL